MSRKLVWIMILTSVLLGMLGSVPKVRRVKASGTIYIRSDGSIYPSTVNITSPNNITYYFTDDNHDEIVVERSNIIIDGNGYALQRSGWEWGSGLSLHSVSNVTIKNTNIRGFRDGVYLNSACNNVISGNNITNNSDGIILERSSNNSITENNIMANKGYSGPAPWPNYGHGIVFRYSSNNFLRDNVMTDNDLNFGVLGSTLYDFVNDVDVSNLVDGKPVYYWVDRWDAEVPSDAGYVALVNCTNVNAENLTLTRNMQGILLAYTTYSTISENNVTSNGNGILLLNSSNNIIRENNVTANYGLGIGLATCSNNTISKNHVTTTDYFGIYLSECSNNTISEINVVTNNTYGIILSNSLDNSLSRNNVANNFAGIGLGQFSTNNTISGNNVTANNGYGITLANSSENLIYNNNFINNTMQVYIEPSNANTWDNGYPSGGNYWSNYTGVDSNQDGIGETPCIIDGNNQDNFPLMGMFSSFNTSYGYQVNFISNSSISNCAFSLIDPHQAALTFNVTGETGIKGFCRICIPKTLINGSYVVKFNGEVITYPQVKELPCSNETHEYLYINYTYSEHTIEISGTTIIPEFSAFIMMPLFMIATVLAVIVYTRKLCFWKA